MKKILILGLSFLGLLLEAQNKDVVFLNQGLLYIAGDTLSSTPTTLYIGGGARMTDTTSVYQLGKSIIKGDFINDVTRGNVFSVRSGSIEFSGDKTQYIRGNAIKAVNYIDFPDRIIIDNKNTDTDSVAVVIDALMAASMKNLDLVRGRLVLDSKVFDDNSSEVAHLLVKDDGVVNYKIDPALPAHENGIVQVKLALGDNYTQGRVVGFTPPFKKIYADYLFYNFLSKPSQAGLFGDSFAFIRDPYTELNAGTGYIIGQGIVPEGDPYYVDEWDPQFLGTVFEDRAKEYLSLARRFAPASFTQFIENRGIADRYTSEVLNIEDVAITLEPGFNYLGNPFTVPLDMSTFVENSSGDGWGVTRASDNSGDVRNSFYVLSQGIGTYHPENTQTIFEMNVSYLIGQLVGGTLTYDGDPSFLVAPMQLFIVGRDAASQIQMTIPKSARNHGKALFLKSNRKTTTTDEIMIETRDSQTKGYDRLCVVFRENSTTLANDAFDAAKIFNRSGGVNQIYTKSSDNRFMTTNVVSPSLKKMVMFFEPSSQQQEVTLQAYRLNSLVSVKSVILEDTQTGKETDLMNNNIYSFISSPSDKKDRFILHFDTESGNIENIGQNDVKIFHLDESVCIEGLSNDLMDAAISVFSMNGQLVYQGKVERVPDMKIQTMLKQGAYIVKIANDKTLVAKKLWVK